MAADSRGRSRTPRARARAPSSADRRRRSATRDSDSPRRGRHEVPSDRGRLHHRAALLQAGEQHRHARRPPVVAPAGSSSPRSSSRTRRRRAGRRRRCRSPVAITAGHDLRRLLLRGARPLRLQPAATSSRRRPTRRCTRPATRPSAATASTSYGASAFPDQTLQRDQLLGRRGVRAHAARRTRAPPHGDARRRRPPARPASPLNAHGHGHVRRAGRPADRQHRLVHAAATAPATRSPATVTYDDATRRRRSRRPPPLALGKTYTAKVKSGNAGVTDLAGNQLAADKTWTFTHARRSARARSSSPTDAPPAPTRSTTSRSRSA